MPDALKLFVATGGHAFARDAFEAMLRAIGTEPVFVDQPAAAMLMNPQALAGFDALLLYDMPGLDFRAPRAVRPAAVPPEPRLADGFEALLEGGKGIVALHHAIAGWPAWPRYGEALGGAFLYKDNADRPASGFRADCSYEVVRVGKDHPVLEGIPDRFALKDELYLFGCFDADVMPLLKLSQPARPQDYSSSQDAVRRVELGRCAHPGTDLIAWLKAAGNSPLVYLQPGDGELCYADPNYRRLLANALHWVASPAARRWARETVAAPPLESVS